MSRRERYRIGEAYGGSATAEDSGVAEWEWVHTGRDFARQHPMGKVRGWMLVVVAFVALHAGLTLYAALTVNPVAIVFTCVDVLALIALLRRQPVAWALTWVPLLGAFPLSLPLIVYWVDGVRPNLIYRHRFERLVRSDEEAVPPSDTDDAAAPAATDAQPGGQNG